MNIFSGFHCSWYPWWKHSICQTAPQPSQWEASAVVPWKGFYMNLPLLTFSAESKIQADDQTDGILAVLEA